MRNPTGYLRRETRIDSAQLAELVRLVSQRGFASSFEVSGSSMMPFIHSGDKVCLSPVEKNEIRRGDVLAFVVGEDSHMLIHRVVKLSEEGFLCKGDNQAQNLDGWIAYDDVIGRVTEIRREGKAVKLGLGVEKGLIARLSIQNRLVPFVSGLRRMKWSILNLFS
ncbi:MAG: signal peptidase I [Anaerolineaceae bacterium]|nr:signal peptidase I [Anaerolineaceae bacterium]